MKFGIDALDEIIEKIYKEELRHVSNVIVGDNASGKSLFLKSFIETIKEESKVYFIDAVNRGFDVKKVTKHNKKLEYDKVILETRLRPDFFNLKDSFNCYGTLTEQVEMIYGLYETETQKLFEKFTGNRFNIIKDNPFGEVDFGNGRGILSSGHQAMIRMLLELLFYQDTEVEEDEKVWIVIDEMDEFLSPKYSGKVLEFFKQEFPWAKWMITTHSCDMVVKSQDANLIILENGKCEIVDINDYESFSEVQIIFERLFGKNLKSENEMDQMLRRLLNNKINQAWGSEDDICLNRLKKENLSASQEIILKQIQEW